MQLSSEVINLGLMDKIRSKNEEFDDPDAATEQPMRSCKSLVNELRKFDQVELFASVAVC